MNLRIWIALGIFFLSNTIQAQLILSTIDTPNKKVTAPSSIYLKAGYKVTAQGGTKYRAFIDSDGDGFSDQDIPPGTTPPENGSLQSFADTKGELSVSNMGTASYVIPIALPPGIRNIAPQVTLSYNSSSDNGMVGYGWNITGISSISRVSTRLDIDGYIDGVNFNSNDRFSLDGQRLLNKEGEYGAEGTIYETENYSNLKIESIGSVTYPGIEGTRPEYFKVTFPDGTQVLYGASEDSRGVTEWLIKKWKDPQGNFIEYFYEKDQNTTYINKIVWGGNENQNTGYSNVIQFYYKKRERAEFAYVHGVKITNVKIMDKVEVTTGGLLFKKYQVNHQKITGNYQRVVSVQEFNGDNEPANPITFSYNNTSNSFAGYEKAEFESLNNLRNINTTGDFDGDGQVDIISAGKLYRNLFNNLGKDNSVSTINAQDFSCGSAINFMTGDKINNFQSVFYYGHKNDSGLTTSDAAYIHGQKLIFKIKDLNKQPNQLEDVYTKEISYPYLGENRDDGCLNRPNYGKYTGVAEIKTITGDFNGDGISEVLVLGQTSSIHYYVDPVNYAAGLKPYKIDVDCNPHTVKSYVPTHYIDLNPNSKQEDYIASGLSLSYNDVTMVTDFDGDGKSDILTINSMGYYFVYSLGEGSRFKELVRGRIPEYDGKKPLLTGDLNGDGKADLMVPEAEGSAHWYAYMFTGKGFEKIKYDNFREYKPTWKGSPSANRYRAKQYHLADLNKDGKSDFIESEYESWTVSPGDRDGRGYIRYFENLGGADKPVFGSMLESVAPRSRYGYEEPIALILANYKNNERTGNFVFVQGSEIWKGNFVKDLRKDILVTKVSESGGYIQSTLEYAPLEPNAKNEGLGDASGVYYSSNEELYPYKEIIKIPNMDVVKKLSVTSGGKTIYQQYKYFGLTVHTQGLGLLGFKKTARSNWMTEENIVKAEIWSVEEMYPQLGRNGDVYSPWISSWTFKGNNYNLISNPQENQLLSKKTTRFFTEKSKTGTIKTLLTDKTEKDFITGVTTSESYQYDSYGNLTQSQSANGVSTVQTDYTYANNPTGANSQYYLGRLVKKEASVRAYNDVYTTEEKYLYTNNLITQTQKKGHNTDYLTELYGYDPFGNLIQKTISAPGVSSLTTKDEYEPTGRFVIKKTDAENQTEYFTYNNLGQVLSHISPLNVKTHTLYDGWGKLRKVTVSGSSDTPLVSYTNYERTKEGGIKITSYDDQTGDYSVVIKDIFGRDIKALTKGFAQGSYVVKDVVYDVLGRKVKESEPYFEATGAPAYWNTIEYDELSRPVKQTLFTKKTIINTYNGLSVTTKEGVKSRTITKDANGNTVKVLDNGEAITYTYYANGTQKTSNYGGHIITTKQDGWGRKIYLQDPSVSTTPYTYSYNNYGELLKETTPEGSTMYTYSPTGKVLTKTITGANTHVNAGYVYSDKGLLLKESGTSNGETYSYTYTYDNRYRLASHKEITPQASYLREYTYDQWGRGLTEKNTTLLGSLSSSVSVQNHYNAYNGILEKISQSGTGKVLWQLTEMNERMQVLSGKLGNGINVKNTIDGAGFITKVEHAGNVSVPLSVSYDFNWERGTLNSRYNQFYNWNEQFTYDTFDRLVSWTDPERRDFNEYASDGRITSNSQVGEYKYESFTRYKKSSINLNPAGKTYYEKKPAQHITYNVFKNPVEITEGDQKIKFGYNLHNSRTSAEVSSGVLHTAVKYYSDDKRVELISDKDGIKMITYISGSPYDAPLMYISRFSSSGAKTEEVFYYLHRDYQGTIMALSDEQGQTVERRLFDPWGRVVKVTDKNGNTQNVNPLFAFMDRGYTGHEHFFTVGLIHMNGRMYDPILKQFLSPDNFIQEAFNSQNYNRYGYVLNNPLMYTDPSGEEFTLAGLAIAAGIGAIIGGTTYTAYALYTDTFSWSGFATSTLMGGVSGAAAYGVGSLTSLMAQGSAGTLGHAMQSIRMVAAMEASTLGSQIGYAVIGAGLHAVSQGIIVGISGGDILSGFSSGGISSLVASAVGIGGTAAGINGGKIAGTLFFGTVSGGFGSALTGGNFWQGAATGLIVSALNHSMHAESPDNGYEKDENGGYRQINDKGGDGMDYLYENGEVIESRVPFQMGGEVSHNRTYGVLANTGTGGALYDPSWDMFQLYVGFGEIKAGFIMIKNGFTLLSKVSLGYKVLGGASEVTLKSSVIAKGIYGGKNINLLNGAVKTLPYISPYGIGKTASWSSFYGRNSAIFGVGRIGIGGILIY